MDDLVRDQVLALQWIKNEDIIVAEKDDGHEYIARFKESLEASFLEGDERRLMQTITVAEAELVEVASIEGGEKD